MEERRVYVQSAVKEFIFDREHNPWFRSCHASTLVSLGNGDILVAWFGGTSEGDPDVDIWCSRRSGANGWWSTPQKVAREDGLPHWNPVLFMGDNQILYLFYKVGPQIQTWQTRVLESHDLGHTWTAPRPLVKEDVGGRGPVKNKPIVLRDGSWLAPASYESEMTWEAFVDISQDKGQSWTRSSMIRANGNGKGVIQPALWESRSGHVHMVLRSTDGCIYRSDSLDGGMTWCAPYDFGLPNNNSGIDVVCCLDGVLALVYNPVRGNWAERSPLVVSFSTDNGRTWVEPYVLEREPGEYSYPAVIEADNKILITYTWNRTVIAYCEVARNSAAL